jgi:hypothetical protein
MMDNIAAHKNGSYDFVGGTNNMKNHLEACKLPKYTKHRLPTHNICANSIYHWIKEIISYIKTNITATVLLAQRLLQILYQGINLILNLPFI